MTQRLSVLQYLRQAGERGVTNGFFADKHILRYSARIWELREEGFEIRTEAKAGTVRFTLTGEPQPIDPERSPVVHPEPDGVALCAEPETLFPEPRTALPHYQDVA